MAKLKILMVSACCCIVLGLLCCAYVSFSNPDSLYESHQWYQSIHANEKGHLSVQIRFGDLNVTQF